MTQHTLAAETDLLDLFRNTFRRHAGGVVVLTGRTPDGEPVGFTATSLASLSAVPARATLNVIKASSSWPAIFEGNRLAVNFLGADTEHLGARFAGPTGERFQGDHWHEEHGLPVLTDAAVTLITEISAVISQNDNAIVVLDILDGHLGEEQAPLLYHDRRFVTIAPAA